VDKTKEPPVKRANLGDWKRTAEEADSQRYHQQSPREKSASTKKRVRYWKL